MTREEMIRNDVQLRIKRGLHFAVDRNGKTIRFKPWLGDAFSFMYDFIMEKSVFPGKFGGELQTHIDILRKELKSVQKKKVLELGTGSGSAVHFLPQSNLYTGTDISPGLLRKAAKRFHDAGFQDAGFYMSSAEDLPFSDSFFDVCLCILSLNFFQDVPAVFREIKRVTRTGASFICSVPVPERQRVRSTIHGTLFSERELDSICRDEGFAFKSLTAENGALLYFRAVPE